MLKSKILFPVQIDCIVLLYLCNVKLKKEQLWDFLIIFYWEPF